MIFGLSYSLNSRMRVYVSAWITKNSRRLFSTFLDTPKLKLTIRAEHEIKYLLSSILVNCSILDMSLCSIVMCDSAAFFTMGNTCYWSATTKVRVEARAQPLGDWLVAPFIMLSNLLRAEIRASDWTCLFVIVIVSDAFSEGIVDSLSNNC